MLGDFDVEGQAYLSYLSTICQSVLECGLRPSTVLEPLYLRHNTRSEHVHHHSYPGSVTRAKRPSKGTLTEHLWSGGQLPDNGSPSILIYCTNHCSSFVHTLAAKTAVPKRRVEYGGNLWAHKCSAGSHAEDKVECLCRHNKTLSKTNLFKGWSPAPKTKWFQICLLLTFFFFFKLVLLRRV